LCLEKMENNSVGKGKKATLSVYIRAAFGFICKHQNSKKSVMRVTLFRWAMCAPFDEAHNVMITRVHKSIERVAQVGRGGK